MKIQSKLFLHSKPWSHLYDNSLCATFVNLNICRRVSRTKLWTSGVVILACVILYDHFFFGIFHRPFEKDFNTAFEYPENIEDFPKFIQNYKYLESLLNVSNKQQLMIAPTNKLYSVVEFVKRADSGCSRPIGLLIIVKSAVLNFEKRSAVRSTWGHPLYLKINSFSEDLPTKLVFIVGQPENESASDRLTIKEQIDLESEMHHDLISATFKDTYNNNTYKSISAFRWAKEICSDFRYLFLVDDDMFISLKNLLLYLRNPMTYELNFPELQDKHSSSDKNKSLKSFNGNELHKEQLFLGKVIIEGSPMRNQYGRNSQWYLPLSLYPFNYFPPYIPGMATLLSKSTVIDFVYASLFTKHLYIDDVYLGILALKLKINPTHSDYFVMLKNATWKPFVKTIEWTEYMIAVHNYTPEDLIQIWKDKVLH